MFPILFFLAATTHLGPMGPDAPAREPQMAANGSMVAMTFGASHAIYFSLSRDGGNTFSPPAKVAEAGIIPLTRHRGPRIAFAGNTIVITAVVGNKEEQADHAHGLPSDGDLTVWRSQDGGKTWSEGTHINDVTASATEGLHALASNGKGLLYAAWSTNEEKARACAPPAPTMAASPGPRMWRCISRRMVPSANAAILLWRFLLSVNCS